MSYSVVQQGLEVPSLDQLKNAFREVPGLTEIDALALGKHAFGILARGFELDMATSLQASLALAGVPAEVLEDASLPQLPETFPLGALECTPEALRAHDLLGRIANLEWRDVYMIAAGRVTVQELGESHPPLPQQAIPAEEEAATEEGEEVILKEGEIVAEEITEELVEEMVMETEEEVVVEAMVITKPKLIDEKPVEHHAGEETHERHLLEIFVAGGALRYSIVADKAPLLFDYLGERRTKDLPANFLLLVQDLIRYAPHAALNRGANVAQENILEAFCYQNKIAFHHEMIWLLWLASRAQAEAEE